MGIIGVGTYLLVESRLPFGPVSARHLAGRARVRRRRRLRCARPRRPGESTSTQLKPKWLANRSVRSAPRSARRVHRPDCHRRQPRRLVDRPPGRRRWLIPIMAIACFPQRSPSACSSRLSRSSCATVVGTSDSLNRSPFPARTFGMTSLRAAWLAIAVPPGLATLVNDVGQLT